MTRQSAKMEAIASLREALTANKQVFIIVRKHSRTGYSKSISIRQFGIRTDAGYHATPENPRFQPLTLTFQVAKAMGYAVHQYEGTDVIRTDDYPQEFVANLSMLVFGKPDTLDCEVL